MEVGFWTREIYMGPWTLGQGTQGESLEASSLEEDPPRMGLGSRMLGEKIVQRAWLSKQGG